MEGDPASHLSQDLQLEGREGPKGLLLKIMKKGEEIVEEEWSGGKGEALFCAGSQKLEKYFWFKVCSPRTFHIVGEPPEYKAN